MTVRLAAGMLVTTALLEACGPHGSARQAGSSLLPATRETVSAGPVGRPGIRASSATVAVDEAATLAISDENSGRVYLADKDEPMHELDPGGFVTSLAPLSGGGFVGTIPSRDEIVVFSRTHAARRLRIAGRPVGVAVDQGRLWVASEAAATVSEIGLADLTIRRTFVVAAGPRAVVVDESGALLVAHRRGGMLSRIDPRAPAEHAVTERSLDARIESEAEVRHSVWQTSVAVTDGRVLVPHVLAASGDPRKRTRGYGDASQSMLADVSVRDAASLDALSSGPIDPLDAEEIAGLSGRAGRVDGCLLPVASTLHPPSGSLVVACRGTDEIVVLDPRASQPGRAERMRVRVGAGVSGITVDPDGILLVHEAFDRTVRRLRIGDGRVETLGVIRLPPSAARRDASWERGRSLFFRVGDTRIASDGRACASCHPFDGDDGLTWSTPDGPRRTLPLDRIRAAGEHATLSWSGTETDLPRRILRTTDRLGATGLLTNAELEDLATYVAALRPESGPAAELSVRARAGKQRFAEMGCASCHSGDHASDGRRHDIGTQRDGDRGPAFATPSLRGIRATPPYFHDGRYPTLRALVFDRASGMGNGSRELASDAALEELLAYLETL